MGRLIERLAEAVGTRSIRTNVRATQASSRESSGHWRVELEHGEPISGARGTACDSGTRRLRAGTRLRNSPVSSPRFRTSRQPRCSPRSAVTRRSRPLEGIGFIVPPGEGRILAGTWISNKWAARSPEGTLLVRAFVGGAGSSIDVARASDDELERLALDELLRLMGPLGEPIVHAHLSLRRRQPAAGGRPRRAPRSDRRTASRPAWLAPRRRRLRRRWHSGLRATRACDGRSHQFRDCARSELTRKLPLREPPAERPGRGRPTGVNAGIQG